MSVRAKLAGVLALMLAGGIGVTGVLLMTQATVRVEIPPLRERREDILPLARLFLARLAQRMGLSPPTFTPQAEVTLARYSYPGNVRELRNIVERAIILAGRAGAVGVESITLPPSAPAASARPAFFSVELDESSCPPTLAGLEKAYLQRLLDFAGGNRSQVARLLGVSYPTVAKKIGDYGLGTDG